MHAVITGCEGCLVHLLLHVVGIYIMPAGHVQHGCHAPGWQGDCESLPASVGIPEVVGGEGAPGCCPAGWA